MVCIFIAFLNLNKERKKLSDFLFIKMQLLFVFFSLLISFFLYEIVGSDLSINPNHQKNNWSNSLNETANNSTNCLVFQKLDYQLENGEISNITPLLAKKPHLFLLKNTTQIVLFSDCEKTKYQPCQIELSVFSIGANSSNLLIVRKLNHTHISDIDKSEGLYSQYDAHFDDLFKLTNNFDGKIEVFRFQPRFSNIEFIDFHWEKLKFTPKDSIIRDNYRKPRFRDEASLIQITLNSKTYLLLTGGINDIAFFNDIWLYDLENGFWTEVHGNFPQLKGHTVNFIEISERYRCKIAIFGGNLNGKPTNSLFLGEIQQIGNDFSLEIKEITFSNESNSNNTPQVREGHLAIAITDKILIFGGCDYEKQQCFSDVFAIDLNENSGFLYQWTRLSKTKSSMTPGSRENAVFFFMPDKKSLFFFNGCDIHGFCYRDGFIGKFYRKCLDDCPENSVFSKGKCRCFPGFFGENCTRKGKICEYNCLNNGECLENGTCRCEDEFFGAFCQFEYCKDSCNNRGYCDKATMRCTCENGFFGVNCKGNCVKNCNGNGFCSNGNCDCFSGFEGKKCEKRRGFEGCWVFNEFDEKSIKKICLIKDFEGKLGGFLYDGNQGFYFKETGIRNKESPLQPILNIDFPIAKDMIEDVIIEGRLYAFNEENRFFLMEKLAFFSISVNNRFFTMEISDLKMNTNEILKGSYQKECESQKDCFGRGFCDSQGKCRCSTHANGLYCQFQEKIEFMDSKCHDNCYFKGNCNDIKGICECFAGFQGKSCENAICPKNCSNSGFCDYSLNKCICFHGFTGNSCEKPLICDANCNNHGICEISSENQAFCRCYKGFFGKKCEKSCYLNCSDRGICDHSTGKCQCEKRYKGSFCEEYRDCPYNCSFRGKCEKGECVCEIGFSGKSCEFEIICPEKCQGKGQCIWGKCVCDLGFEGKACEHNTGRYLDENIEFSIEVNKSDNPNNKREWNIGKKAESINGSLNEYINGSLNGSLNGSINGSLNGSLNGSINGSIMNRSGIMNLMEKIQENNEFSFKDIGVEEQQLDFFKEKEKKRMEKETNQEEKQENLWILSIIMIIGITILFILNNVKKA